MNQFLLQLLGVRGPADSIVSVGAELQPAISWGWWLLLAAGIVAMVVLGYRRFDVGLSRGRVQCLIALRLLALLAIAAVLLRPGLGVMVEGMVRQRLVLLLDQSASMALRDPRRDPADQVRAALALGQLKADGGLRQDPPAALLPAPSRIEILGAVLTNRELALASRLQREFDLRVGGFAGGWVPVVQRTRGAGDTNSPTADATVEPGPDLRLVADGRTSAPGQALLDVLEREQGQPLGAVILFTDGIRNDGPDPREVTARLREAGAVLHVVGLGTTAPGDLQVVDLEGPEVAFARDEVRWTAHLRRQGLQGQAIRVRLTLDGAQVGEVEAEFETNGVGRATFRFTPETPGDFEVRVEAPALPDEILAENNRQVRRLRVMDDRIRVLMLEQSPRWEFRYLQALLMRDRRVDLKCVLFDGDPAISRSPGSPYLEALPARREELFAYDLIVFGDVDPRNFTPAQLDLMAEFVSRSGGSFLMVAGRRFSPWGYRDTALERMLPVEFGRAPAEAPGISLHDRPVKLTLSAAGRLSPLMRLADDPEENLRRWEQLPPLFWTAPVGRAKPAATVLVSRPESEGSEATIPVIAIQQYGVGQSMFVGTDNSWRWRRNEGEQFHVAFWARTVQRLAFHHLVSGSRRTQISVDETSPVPGERIGVNARLFTSAFEPLTEPTVAARVERHLLNPGDPPGPSTELLLRAVPDQPGLYRGELMAPPPGGYRLRIGEDAQASVDFTVEDRYLEAGETAMQEGTLREWAMQGGGGFFREEDLHRLPDLVRSRAEKVQSKVSVDLWSSPFYYLAVLLLLGVEWGLRKWWQLK